MNTATLTWTNPTTRTDGSTLPPDEIAWIEIKDDEVILATLAGNIESFTTGTLDVGPHRFCVHVIDTHGLRSTASNISVTNIFPVANAPSAVVDLKSTIEIP